MPANDNPHRFDPRFFAPNGTIWQHRYFGEADPVPETDPPAPPKVPHIERFVTDGELPAYESEPVLSDSDMAGYRTDAADNVWVIHLDGTKERIDPAPEERPPAPRRQRHPALAVRAGNVLAGVGVGMGVFAIAYLAALFR